MRLFDMSQRLLLSAEPGGPHYSLPKAEATVTCGDLAVHQDFKARGQQPCTQLFKQRRSNTTCSTGR